MKKEYDMQFDKYYNPYAREVVNGAALIICPKCRGVCPGKFECDKIEQYINETIHTIMKGEK